MTPNEYLDAAKATMEITSDYELAQRFQVTRQRISGIRKGDLPMDNGTAFQVAITLEVDPATVIADLESQREKNAKRKEFWTGFIRRAAVVAALACTLALNYSATYEDAAAMLGGVVMAASVAFLLTRPVRIICRICKAQHFA